MSYNVETIGADFVIPPENLDACFEALKALNKRDELKTGGSYGRRPDGSYGQISAYFAWMSETYDEECRNAAQIFEELGFTTSEDDEGLRLEWFDNNKTGAEAVFLEAAAPFVRPGSYLEWEGEDRSRWRQDFDGTTMTTRTGTITWDD
jgi:hypothetical protein